MQRMAVRHIARPSETTGFCRLIRRGAYRQALTEIVGSQLGKDVSQYCYVMVGDREPAETALLDTWVALYGAMPFLADTPLRPWIFDCARQECNRQRAAQQGTQPQASEASPEASLRARLAELQSEELDAVLLRYIARLDYGDIADICGLDTQTARRLAGKALLRLRQGELGLPTTATSASAVMPSPLSNQAPSGNQSQRRAGR